MYPLKNCSRIWKKYKNLWVQDRKNRNDVARFHVIMLRLFVQSFSTHMYCVVVQQDSLPFSTSASLLILHSFHLVVYIFISFYLFTFSSSFSCFLVLASSNLKLWEIELKKFLLSFLSIIHIILSFVDIFDYAYDQLVATRFKNLYVAVYFFIILIALSIRPSFCISFNSCGIYPFIFLAFLTRAVWHTLSVIISGNIFTNITFDGVFRLFLSTSFQWKMTSLKFP